MLSTGDFLALAREVLVCDYHLMLVGDGSGMTRHQACGWCCNLYDRTTQEVTEYFGGASHGTNNYAELAPYLHALWAFHTAWKERNPDGRPFFKVLIITDSELTASCGSGRYARRANLSLWASVDWFAANGYHFMWRHVPRNSNPLSTRADKVAGLVRLALKVPHAS